MRRSGCAARPSPPTPHRPLKRIDRHTTTPASFHPNHIAQRFLPILRAQRLKRPRRVRAQFRRHASSRRIFRDSSLRVITANSCNSARTFSRPPDPCVPPRRRSRSKACSPPPRCPATRSSSSPAHSRIRFEHRTFTRHHTMMLGHFIRQEGRKISGSRTCDVPSKYPRDRSKLNVIMLRSTFSGPRIRRICRNISSTRTSDPVLRVRCSPQTAISISRPAATAPACHHPLDFLALDNARYPRFQNESIMRQTLPPLCSPATLDMDIQSCARG